MPEGWPRSVCVCVSEILGERPFPKTTSSCVSHEAHVHKHIIHIHIRIYTYARTAHSHLYAYRYGQKPNNVSTHLAERLATSFWFVRMPRPCCMPASRFVADTKKGMAEHIGLPEPTRTLFFVGSYFDFLYRTKKGRRKQWALVGLSKTYTPENLHET